jgi:hypothetical protein
MLGLNILLTRAQNISNIPYNLGKLYLQFAALYGLSIPHERLIGLRKALKTITL